MGSRLVHRDRRLVRGRSSFAAARGCGAELRLQRSRGTGRRPGSRNSAIRARRSHARQRRLRGNSSIFDHRHASKTRWKQQSLLAAIVASSDDAIVSKTLRWKDYRGTRAPSACSVLRRKKRWQVDRLIVRLEGREQVRDPDRIDMAKRRSPRRGPRSKDGAVSTSHRRCRRARLARSHHRRLEDCRDITTRKAGKSNLFAAKKCNACLIGFTMPRAAFRTSTRRRAKSRRGSAALRRRPAAPT